MNILKIGSIVLYLFIVNVECGLLDTVFGTVKNTTHALRADIHNFVSYGNDLVFGDGVNKNVIPNNGTEEPKTEGLITNLYHKTRNAVSAVHQRIRKIIVKDDSAPAHKGIITKTFDSIHKKLKSIQERFHPIEDPNKLIDKPVQNIYGNFVTEDSKAIRDKIIQILYHNNTNIFNKLNISQVDIQNLVKDVKSTVNNDLVFTTDAKEKDDEAFDIDVRSLADNVESNL